MKSKTCKSCKQVKPVTEFYKEHGGLVCGATAWRPRCKVCHNKQGHNRYLRLKKNGRPQEKHYQTDPKQTTRLLAW